jgi:hypothetical protein
MFETDWVARNFQLRQLVEYFGGTRPYVRDTFRWSKNWGGPPQVFTRRL